MAQALLEEAGHVVFVGSKDRNLSCSELLEAVRGRDAIIPLLSDRIDEKVLDAASPPCRIIANYAVGYNNIDVPAATKRGVLVTNTPGVLTDTTADLAWALLMTAARRTAEADRFMRANCSTGFPGWNGWSGWKPEEFLGVDVAGGTIGIIGAGRIGTEVARRATGFKMSILYCDVGPNEALEREFGARRCDLDTLLEEADFVSVHVPLSDETHHLIGGREFALMKRTAVLVNTSRGPVVDEAALVEALRSGRIAAAGLDVYEREPELTPGLAALPNVVIVPHIGSATTETRAKMARMAAENVVAALEGRTPPNLVNTEVTA